MAKQSLFKALVLVMTLMGVAMADNEDAELLGLRHRNETTPGALTRVSMAGGLEFFIDGKGFDDMPSINQVKLATKQGDAAQLIGKPLSIDDQIQSATVLGRLAYTMPSISDLFRGADISAISTHYIANKDENLNFSLRVSNTAEATDSSCPEAWEGKCEVKYNMRFTPLLHDVVPNEVYHDQEINIIVNAMEANTGSSISADMDPVVFIKINGTRCDSEGFIDYQTRLGKIAIDGLKTRAGDQHPGLHTPEVRFRVGNAFNRESSKHCNFEGTECWHVKTHPKIDSISADAGYTTGGQTLTIKGWGLKGTTLANVDVKVDGVSCKVLTSTLEQITCVTGAAAAVSHAGEQPGSPGLRQKVIDPTNTATNPYWGMRTDSVHPVVETRLLSGWEDAYKNYTRAATHTKGWFKAPAAGKYRFYLACDDFCKTWFSSDKFDKTKQDAYTMTEINRRNSATGWRQYHAPADETSSHKWVSDWITLEAGEFYKVEGFHGEYTNGDHATVSVEYEKSSISVTVGDKTSNHHHASKEVQQVQVNNEIEFERFNITVKSAMGGKFQLLFVNPKYDPTKRNSPKTITTRSVKDNDSASAVRRALGDFFWRGDIWGSDIEVTKLNTNDKFETAEGDAITQIVFQVRVKRSIPSASFAAAQVVKAKTTSSVITLGTAYTTSTPPIEGNFVIACKNSDGNEFVTREMGIWTDTNYIAMYMHWDIPHLQFKMFVYGGSKYEYRCNGLDFILYFQDLHSDPAQCEIRTGSSTALSGGKTLTYSSTTTRPYGKNLMFEPVPLDMLYHDAEKPQVLVKVNKLAGICHGFNCDYVYETATSKITAQALANGKDVKITGTSLPTTNVRVVLGNTECGAVTATATEVTCTLTVLPAAGSWNVELYEAKGLVPIADGTAKIDVSLVVSSISPKSSLNQLGGDVITIVGTGFDKDKSKVTVAFSDTTKCDVQSSSATEIKCLIAGFDAAKVATASKSTTVTVNGVTNSDLNVALKATKQSGTGISPASASPVLPTSITVTLDAGYPGDMTSKEDFTAKLISEADATKTRALYVKSVDAVNKKVVVKFPGAESGSYFIALEGKGVGRIDQANLKLKVEGRVTGIAPLQGSYLGGTLVTIDGVNFSKNKLDNPVKVGNFWCLVQTTNASQITCRVAETKATESSDVKVSTFLRTQEEAKNDVANDFGFKAPVATVSGLTAAFDTATKTQVLTLAGSGFGTDITKPELIIDGQKQTCTTITDTEAKFTLTHLDSETSNVVQIYFPDGYPTGYATIKKVAVTPNLVSISPRTGSAGGTLLTVTGTGFGKKTSGLTLVNSSDADVCASVTVTAYGTFTCLTKPGEMLKSSKLSLKTAAAKFACANTDATQCDFEQLTASSPTVSSATVSDASTVAVVGTSFPTSGYTAKVIFKGVESTSATIDSATGITATFAKGVPVSKDATAPIIRFTPSSRRMLSGNANFLQAAGDAKITNQVSVTASTTGLECSFQGGCKYEVTAAGLTSTLKASGTSDHIDVCGERCELIDADSNSSKAACTLPHVVTSYSATEYKVVTTGTLHTGTWTGTASTAELKKLVDGKNLVDLSDSTSSDCHFQIAYKANHVGVLDEAKFFVNNLLSKTPFIGMKFQGSNDGTTFTDLWTIDEQVHEGWNSKDFEAKSKPAFNIYRFQGKTTGSCRIGEVRLNGIESIQDDKNSYACTPKLMVDGVATDLSPVTFKDAKTPKLTAMSTRFGSVLGGESIIFTGTGFSDTATTTVTIDNIACAVTAKTTESITCTTGKKAYKPDTPKLVINIEGFGNVATMGKEFLYVSKWSDAQTWGNDLSPQEGEAVSVPKGQHLLFDIKKGPKLSFLNVEGSLIFPPDADASHERTFDAHYVLVKGGRMEVGTAENRYTSKMKITLWSTKFDPNIPIFGNKVIGVNYGTLDMHGIERPITWRNLKVTADAGAKEITINDMKGTALDWKVGEEIVIAPTTYSGRDAEQRTITAITDIDSNPVIKFTEPLKTKHYAGVQNFGTGDNADSIEMRAEVGLLTRNVKFQGDPVHSPDNQYGAVIICHSPGDESTTCRIDSVELTLVGQAFILGSYPIHFHMIGTVHSSYVRNNAIHHTFNRAVTIHGVHYLRVQNNVAYHTMGHTIFIEDAVESKNLIEGNLILDVRRSWSLLNTDQTPASIWITNPDNIIRNNAAGGSDRYSYWYDLQETAIGPSFDANVCPENQKLGEFKNNVAHSNGRYGLRIFHNHIPRQKQCDPIVYDKTAANYNPPITAKYENLVSYKNKRNGAIIERAGAIEWHNFKTADNLEVGMEMSRTDDNGEDNWAKIVGGLVIGKSENTEEALDKASPVGVRTPRTENFNMSGVKFYNYNWNKAAGMHTCSHCWHDNNTDSGARTITVDKLYFDEATVKKRVSYTTPFRTIFFDKSGGLTGKGPNTWFLPYFKHLLVSQCEQDDVKGGITCDNTVQARRIAIWGLPTNFFGMRMKIVPMSKADEATKTADGSLKTFLDDEKNYGIALFKDKQLPSSAWAMPYVTGHRYRLHWEAGLDFDSMKIEISERWAEADLPINLVFNFTEKREAINITTNYGGAGKVQIENNTLSTGTKSGAYQMRNSTDIKEFEILINGKDATHNKLLVRPLECISGICKANEVAAGTIPAVSSKWSDAKTWGGTLPKDGDEVEITASMWVELDIAETPKLKSLQINGRLSFKDDKENLASVSLKSNNIWVRQGELLIGTKDKPYQANALIELLGATESDTLTLGGTVKAGNKVLASTKKVEIFGKPRSRMGRLLAEASAGDKDITVASDLDWAVGDKIFLATSTIQATHSEYRTITAISAGKATLDRALSYYHFGAAESTATLYNGIDIRTEVLLMTRNVKIMGEKKDGWAGHILVTDELLNSNEGYVIMDNVEVENCSQKDKGNAAIRFESALGSSTTYSKISNSAVHEGDDWGLSIQSSNNIEIIDNSFTTWRAIGVAIDKTNNITFTGNFIGDTAGRKLQMLGMAIDKEGCVAYGSYGDTKKGTSNVGTVFKNNIAAGCAFAGFVAPSTTACGETNNNFHGNIAHSSNMVGAYMYPNPSSSSSATCMEFSHFSAYKTQEACVVTMAKTKLLKASHITCLDVQQGVSLNTGGQENDKVEIILEDSHFFGESASKDCPSVNGDCWCKPKFAFMNAQNMNDEKDLHPTMKSALPIQKSHGEGNWGGKMTINRTTFSKFMGKSMCGEKSVIFNRNPDSSDKIPPHYFNDCTFDDVDNTGWAFLEKSDPGWANVKDCGDFPCTAPNNLIYSFTGTKFTGTTKPTTAVADFVIVPDEKTVGGTYPNCNHFPEQQIYVCQLTNIGMIQFENLDKDAWDRAIQPVTLSNAETGFSNVVNAMMDHIWDTFYTGQRRMARFPTAMLTGQDYRLEFAGTPPQKVRYGLEARTGGTKILVPYPVAGTYQVSKANSSGAYSRVDNNAWDDTIKAQGAITKTKGCGENRFVGIENYLEFYLEPGCDLLVQPKDSIQAKVRMDWSMSEFFADGGTTRFVDRLAASLGVPSYRIKVVSVYEGSVVVDFAIESEPVATTSTDANGNVQQVDAATVAAQQAAATAALANIKTALVQQATSGSLATAIGAPVMGLEANNASGQAELLAGDPIPAAPTKNPTILVPGSATPAGALSFACAWIAMLALAINLI